MELRDAGKAILLVSVELDEILSLSDRIAVMFDGRIMGERRPEETDERELGLLMAGVDSVPAGKSEAESRAMTHALTGLGNRRGMDIALDRISALLPGSEAPTVLRLDGSDDKVAVHAVCRENVFWETLENLKAAGASSLLVLPVEKMLA